MLKKLTDKIKSNQSLAEGQSIGENQFSLELWWSLLEKVRTYYQQNPE
jgi:hypothetical protein